MRRTRKRIYKTLKGLCSQLEYNQIDGETMKYGRGYFKDGWHYDFRIEREAEDEFWYGLAKVVWKKPTDRQISCLRYAKDWMLRRLTWHPKYGFSYCAGQDYPGEIRSIQHCVNKG